MIEMYVNEMLIEIIIVLICAAIIGAATSFFVLIKCVHKQARDMRMIKKATAFVLGRQVRETKSLHPDEIDEIEDLEKIYKDLINDS